MLKNKMFWYCEVRERKYYERVVDVYCLVNKKIKNKLYIVNVVRFYSVNFFEIERLLKDG